MMAHTDIKAKRAASDAGVTLLEVMVVLAIIGLIATLAAPRIIDSFGRAKSQTARVQLENVKAGLQLFYIDVGRYPSEAEHLSALLVKPAGVETWSGPYVDEESLTDPWARELLYRQPGQSSDFDLFSYGRDGQPGGEKEDSDIYL